jgi:membrane protein DedA with SNARE-associated domain
MLTHTHSGLRWIALILLIYAVYNAFSKRNSLGFSKQDKMVNLFAMVTLHVQLILGLVLYFTSTNISFEPGWMEVEKFRFYGMEHFAGMLIAIVLVTIGYSKAKRTDVSSKKHKSTYIFYGLGLLLILLFIPWPFRAALGGAWF